MYSTSNSASPGDPAKLGLICMHDAWPGSYRSQGEKEELCAPRKLAVGDCHWLLSSTTEVLIRLCLRKKVTALIQRGGGPGGQTGALTGAK